MKKFLSILMAMLLIVVMSIPAFAAPADDLGIPSPNSVWIDKTTYPVGLITSRGGQYYLNLFTNVPYVSDLGSEDLKVSGGYQQYILSDGLWEFQMTSDNDLTINDYVFIWSSHDIYDYHDDLFFENNSAFFPRSLSEVVQETTTETLQTETLPAVAGTMTTLTLCGVGLMALLVVLSLFGKRSLISRG